MQTILIVATDSKSGIGNQGALPWHSPSDLRRFRDRTMGHALVMGRTTYDSIGRPLPGRSMHVVSRTLRDIPGVQVHATPLEALEAARRSSETVFVAGGAQIYRALIGECDSIERTIVPGEHDCDAWYDVDESAFVTASIVALEDGCVLHRLNRR